MTTYLLFMGGGEIFVILLVVLVLFGSKRIPEIARGLGKGMNEFKKATDNMKQEMSDTTSDIKEDINNIQNNIKNV